MSRTMPKQKPGKSEQVVRTPPEFLNAVKSLLGIHHFAIDLSALEENAVAERCYTPTHSGLIHPWYTGAASWGFCNPEYSDIAPWVEKAAQETRRARANSAVLIPASVGSNWWADYVHAQAMVLFLKGRITFLDKMGKPICSPRTGKPTPYPKDLALLLYSPHWAPGYEPWDWRREV